MAKDSSQRVPMSLLRPNPDNPRFIRDEKFEKLVESIGTFPEMMSLRPMVVDFENDGLILGGNMRYHAIKALEYKKIPSSWVKDASKLTPEQKQEFIIKDNIGFGDWDYDALANNWDSQLLDEWGMDAWNPEESEEADGESGPSAVTHKIVIECASIEEQEQIYDQLSDMGIVCKMKS